MSGCAIQGKPFFTPLTHPEEVEQLSPHIAITDEDQIIVLGTLDQWLHCAPTRSVSVVYPVDQQNIARLGPGHVCSAEMYENPLVHCQTGPSPLTIWSRSH
jgi:hypothetical protein